MRSLLPPLAPWCPPRTHRGLATIVMVTFNKVDVTKRCLASVYARTKGPFEVVVVDNASSDGTAEIVAALGHPNLRVIANDKNLGFGAGCNIGAKAAKGEWLVLLNNDTLVCEGWLDGLVDKLTAHPQLGMVGPMTNVASNAQRLDGELSTRPEDFEQVAARLRREEKDRIVLLRRVIGFCVVMRTSLFHELGCFDEAFGVGHYEDDDLSLRAERAGWLAAVARDVYVHHFAGSSFDAAKIDSLANIRAKAFLFYRKWGNAYLDWPDLRHNLRDAFTVVVPVRDDGDPLPSWSSGTPFVTIAVASRPSEAIRKRLERAFAESTILAYRIGDGSIDEALSNFEHPSMRGTVVLDRPMTRDEVEAVVRRADKGEPLGSNARFLDLEKPQRVGRRKRWTSETFESARPASDVVNVTMLSYDRLDFTKQAVEAVRRHTTRPYRLVVVDNGSSLETVAWLKDARTNGLIDVLLLNPQNLGVAIAANQGWRVCETSHFVKLDNDIVIEKNGWLEALVEAAGAIEDAGTVGYSFEHATYPTRTVNGIVVRPKDSHLGGACILVTRRAHTVAGFWSEDYFPYSEEDLDMGLRLNLAGLKHYYLEETAIGVHLPRGKATHVDIEGSFDDEDDPAYRRFKDEARRRHRKGTLFVNEKLYQRGHKPIYVTPGSSPSVRLRVLALLYRAVVRWQRRNVGY